MNTKLRWIPWALAAVLAVSFAVTLPVALRKPRNVERVVEKKVEVPVQVTNTITNNITNSIPVTVEKIVEIPAEIPPVFKLYELFATNYYNAEFATNDFEALKGIGTLKVTVSLGSALNRVIGEESARAKFELKLRQLGVPISESAPFWVNVGVNGLWDDQYNVTLTYSIRTTVSEIQTIAHEDAFHRAVITSWENGAFGFAGRTVAPDAIAKAIEGEAEKFANAYLRANSVWLATKKKFAEAGVSGVAPSTSAASNAPTLEIHSFGTGFFVTEDGYLLSNHHVIKGAKSIFVKSASGFVSAKVVSMDSQNDIALLKVEGRFKPLPLVASRDVKLGASVFTLGFPNPELQGVSAKLTKGEISSLSGIRDDPRQFQISVPVQPGNSGGPLIDDSGNVVGIVTARLSEAASLTSSGMLPQNVNYALKSSFVSAFLEAQNAVASRLPKPRTLSGQKLEDLVKDSEQSISMVVTY